MGQPLWSCPPSNVTTTTSIRVLIISVLDYIICELDFCLLDFYLIALDNMCTRFLKIYYANNGI